MVELQRLYFKKIRLKTAMPRPTGVTGANKSNLNNIVDLIIDTLKIQK